MESIPDEMDRTVNRFPPVRPPSKFRDQPSSNTNICSSKQRRKVDRSKYQINHRSTSLPSRHTFSSNINTTGNVRQRQRHASDSNRKNPIPTTSIITSFLQYLRSELRATTNNQKYDYLQKKSTAKLNYLSQPLYLSNQFYRQQYPVRMSTTPASSVQSIESNFSRVSNENLLEKNFDQQDEHEIYKLINLLILRVECLTNENLTDEKRNSLPTIKQVDEDLIEYLYYLFNKFTQDEVDSSAPMIDKTNFVHVCQTLARHECLNNPSSDQSSSETIMIDTTNSTLTQAFVREYRAEIDDLPLKTSSLNEQISSSSINDQETWLVVDFEPMKPKYSATTPDQSKCLLPSSSSSSSSAADEQLLLFPNENYFSFEEVKSCESESSQSNYFSLDSSLVDIQNMVQELDEINHNNNNNNNTLFNEDRTVTSDHTSSAINVVTGDTNKNSISTGLTVDSSNEHVPSMESTELVATKTNEKISRRERKMQERWTNSTNHTEQLPSKTFLGVEFPPIAVLRRKFSSLPPTSSPILTPLPIKKKNSSSSSNKVKAFLNQIDSTASLIFKSSMSLPDQEIDPSIIVEQTKAVQMLDLQATDTSSLNDRRNDDIQAALTSMLELLTDQNNIREEMNENIEQEPNVETSPSSSSTSPTLTTKPDEEKISEYISKEIEEEHGGDDGDNVDREKKNEYIDHASGTVSINNELTEVVLLEQEKEKEEEETERPSSSFSSTEEPRKHLQPEDEPSESILTNNSEVIMNMNENEQRYKTVLIEEIPDEDDDLSMHNNTSIEPTDCILTDDELKISKQSSNIKTFKLDPTRSSYGKVLSKTVETFDHPSQLVEQSQLPPIPKRNQRPEDDPIALRALQRFEERMNAAAKTSNEETSPSILKGKSSWSGTLSTPRKSVENLFKANQQTESISTPTTDEVSSKRDTFIRPRKTMLDDIGLNFGMTLNLFGSGQNKSMDKDDQQQKLEEQQQPTAPVEDDNKQNEPRTNLIDPEDFPRPMNIDSSMTNESSFANKADPSNSLPAPPIDSSSTSISLDTVISQSSPEQQTLSPYRLELEGRRRLNTLEHIRERRPTQELNDPPQQLQLKNEYTLKPEDLQDPIIRRALERFDEKSRSLTQAKTSNYDDVQDPITRRALMRLDTNLKRTIPSHLPPSTNADSSETWYTNSYTLGSLQSNNDPYFIRYPDSSLPPTGNHKPSHVSVHQRFCSTSSSELSEFSPNSALSNNDQNIPIMRVPAQPIYVTSNHQPVISFRQRSRSEDMLSSRELSIGQTSNLDEMDISPLQRNHSSNELQAQPQQVDDEDEDAFVSNESDFPVPTPIIKTLDPNFIRSSESSLNYATPTQTYAAYSCEYTRPHQHQPLNSAKSELSSPRNFQQENEMQSSSAFLPVHPPRNHYYSQPPLPTPSYNSIYTSNNSYQTPYSDDPIVRRALERFNSQMQNSLMSDSQHPPNVGYMSRQFSNGYPPRQGTFDGFHPADPQQHEAWSNTNRPISTPSTTTTGYQSIIGRRRQIRHDDAYHDLPSIGNGYSTSLFLNSQNLHPYMNFPEEAPVVPPRLHRDLYHEQPEYLSENMNNNNNNNGYGHHGYPGAIINGFHPMHQQYIPGDYFQQVSDEEYLRNRAQSTSSNTSSDSVNHSRLMQHRLPPTSVRTHLPTNKTNSSDQSQQPSDQIIPTNGNAADDSVFHRLAYTATKSSLCKSSSNLCANVLTKPPPPSQQEKSRNLNTQEVDYDESSTNNEQNTDSISSTTNISSKCQRSRSVDGRARIKNAHTRANNPARSTNDDEDSNHSTAVPSSKFTSVNPRRDAPPPRLPIIPRSNISDRTSASKRVPNGHNLSYTKNGHGTRVRGSNANLIDTENEETSSLSEHYQPKIMENKTRTTIPVHRSSTTNNHIQPSASTSSMNSTHSRTKLPIPTSMNLDRRDSNTSGSDLSRSAKRSDDNRLLSPTGHRRTIPVSVFAPAKLESKHLVPPPASSTSPANESISTLNSESQQEYQTSFSSTNPDSTSPAINGENEFNQKLSSTNSTLKSSSGNLLNELSLTNDKHDNSKKMNVFERLFRGHKKKI